MLTLAGLAFGLIQAAPVVSEPCAIANAPPGASCGVVTVYENRQRGSGRRLELHYMVVPALDAGANGAGAIPIVPIPGGPGGAIRWLSPGWTRILGESRQRHPVLFLDPRGTGNPGPLECAMEEPGEGLAGYFGEFMPLARVRACRDSLSRIADLTQYSTESIAADLDDVRRALRFPKLILYGVSGGTRQALVYLKRYPARVQAVILGGVVSNELRLPLYYARDGQAAFDSLAADCSADSLCARAFPRFREELAEVLARLQRQPAKLPLGANAADTALITRDVFAEQLRTQLYRPDYAARLPLIVHRAHAGDFLPFARTVVPEWRAPPPSFIAMGHYLAITCAEDVARLDSVSGDRQSRGTFLGNYRVLQQVRACGEWPVAALPSDHFEPVRSDVAVLVISGAADPVTPPRFAEEVLQHLPNSRHLVFPDGAHVPFNTPCATFVVKQFIDGVAPANLKVSCVREFRRPPFVIQE